MVWLIGILGLLLFLWLMGWLCWWMLKDPNPSRRTPAGPPTSMGSAPQ